MAEETSYRHLRERVGRIAHKVAGPMTDAERHALLQMTRELEHIRIELQERNDVLRKTCQNLETEMKLYRNFFENAPVANLVLNDQGAIERANEAAGRVLHQGDASLIGKRFAELLTPDDQNHYFRAIRKIAATKEPHSFELQLANRPPSTDQSVHLHIRAAVQCDRTGRMQYWQLACFDVSVHRRREAELQQLHAQLQMAARAAQLGTWSYDLERGTTRWDRGLYRLLRLKPREGPEDGGYFFDFIHPDDRTGILKNIETLLDKEGNDIKEEFRVVRADGEVRWLAARGRIFRDAHGRPRYIAGINFDITDRKQAEETIRLAQIQMARQLSETERANEELSQYAYAVSHDLKGPLRAVRNYADFLYEDLADTLAGEQKKYLEGMKKAVQQGDELIDDLLSLSRIDKMELDREKADVAGIVNEIRSLLGPADDLAIEVEATWPAIYADHMVLKQILQNLVNNAAKFNRSNPRRIQVAWQPAPQDTIEIMVRDNGIGIPAQYQEQIFHIFQRLHTQEEFEGSGIGLAIVRKAAHKLGGTVRLESEPGRGSSFFVRLPREMADSS
jgi:PAS domain S-box-containing protein